MLPAAALWTLSQRRLPQAAPIYVGLAASMVALLTTVNIPLGPAAAVTASQRPGALLIVV